MLSAHDIALVQRKLVQMIGTAVDGLNNLDKIVPAEKGLGARHSRYGVTSAHYGIVAEALLWTLARGLGEDFTHAAPGSTFTACSARRCRRALRKSSTARRVLVWF